MLATLGASDGDFVEVELREGDGRLLQAVEQSEKHFPSSCAELQLESVAKIVRPMVAGCRSERLEAHETLYVRWCQGRFSDWNPDPDID